MELLLSIVIGVVTGVIASWLFWHVLYYGFAPKIAFSGAISKRDARARGCGFEYCIKMYNVRKRTAVDARLTAYVTIPGLSSAGTDDVYYVPLGTKRIMEMVPKSRPGRNAHLVILNLDKERFTEIFSRIYFPEQVRFLAKERRLSLEDVLGVKDGSHLRLLVKVTDSVSGDTRVHRSKDYELEDIVYGYFKKKSLSVVPKVEVPVPISAETISEIDQATQQKNAADGESVGVRD